MLIGYVDLEGEIYLNLLREKQLFMIKNSFISSLKEIKRFSIGTDINSVALHPNQSCFVAGGEDFLMYKYDYNTGLEQGKKFGNVKWLVTLVFQCAIQFLEKFSF